MMENASPGKRMFVLTLELSLLLFLTVLVYQQVGGFDFISMDDPVYVTENPYVNRGFTVEGIRWALDFGHDSGPYWMPVTMISHMADSAFFGLDAGRHHVHNVVLHLLNIVLLFVFFYKATGDYGKSLFISALFALHPLNVESVAWVTGRKNLLSTVFLLLTLLAYLAYVKRKNLSRYLVVLVFYILGLASKASVIPLIFSLLLLDIWPLNRFLLEKDADTVRFSVFNRRNIAPVLEKIPLLLVTGLVLYLNFSRAAFVHEATPMDKVGMDLRVANALVAYVVYMVQTVWPLNLSVHYPYPESLSLWKTVPAVLVLAGVSVAALFNFKRRPWLFVGWFFFIGNLVMVSGVIQGGLWPAHADRFMYVPAIGLFILIAWLGAEKLKGSAAWGAAMVFCLFLAGLSPVRVADWKDSVTLYRKALDVNPDDMVSTVNLAFALDKAGQVKEALPYYEKIVERYPAYAEVHANMAVILAEQGQADRARHHFEQAVERAPKSVAAWFNKGLFHLRLKETENASVCFARVLELKPDHTEALQSLAAIHIENKHYDRATALYKQALDHMPGAGLSIRYNLACAYAMNHETGKALDTLEGIVADGFNRIDLMMQDEQLENVRHTEGFRRLLADLESRKP